MIETPDPIEFDPAEVLDTPEAIAAYLEAAFEGNDPKRISRALGVIARAKGMSAVAREAGVRRETLYKALSEDSDPRLSTFIGVMDALGLKLAPSAA